MSTVQLSDALIERIEAARVADESLDAFVERAVQEKLAEEERKREFFRLSDEMRAAMLRQGLTEEQIIAEFDALRHSS